MLQILSAVGARARWALVLGIPAALIIPGPGDLLAGTIPFWVALLLCLAMTRIDLGAVARRALVPSRLLPNLLVLVLMMGVTPVALWGLGTAIALPPLLVEALVYTTSAPPLGSAAAFCLLMGLDAAFALELTLLGSFVAPISMPLMSRALVGDAVPVEAFDMFLRLAVVIAAAGLGAVMLRRWLGARRIEQNVLAFDGASSLILVLFLFPLFNAVPALVTENTAFALVALSVAFAANLGVQMLTFHVASSVAGHATGGSLALMLGNRNAALTLSFLPEAPLIVLYIALYQFPMYATPLVMRWFIGRFTREM